MTSRQHGIRNPGASCDSSQELGRKIKQTVSDCLYDTFWLIKALFPVCSAYRSTPAKQGES